jgi:hypothetical protein
MYRRIIFTLITAFSVAFVARAADEKKSEAKKPEAAKEQTLCPVMQRYPVDKTEWIDIKGYRIYTCCKGCINQIKANPDKYIMRLEDKGVVIEKAPEKKDGKKDDTK